VLVFVALVALGYGRCFRSARAAGLLGRVHAWCFGFGLAVSALASSGPMAAQVPVLFWVRALQVLLLLYVAPLLLALGRPWTALRAVSEPWRQRVDGFLGSKSGRMLGSPWLTSLGLMITPWLLYFTPWYVASMRGPLAELTRILLLTVGFGYFYVRLQADPVPHRHTPLLSMAVSVGEGLADGILGVVLWLGPLVASDYYASLVRPGGLSMRVDQAIGAGILWIGGDVFGLVFLTVLMHSLGVHERRRAAEVDAERDDEPVISSTLWWEEDPQLRDRFDRR